MSTFKKYAAFFAVICLLLCSVFAFASCGDDEDTTTYSVSVKDQNGAAVADVEIAFIIGAKTETKKTDENGKVSFETAITDTAAKVKVVSVPAGYSIATTEYNFAEGSTSVDVSVSKLASYTVVVKDQNGAFVKGANVNLLVNGVATVAKNTDANGAAVFAYAPAAVVKAVINSVPEGYEMGEATEFDFAANANAVTINNIVKLTNYTIVLKDQFGEPIVGANVQVCALDEEGNAGVCATPVDTDEDGVAVFAMKPAAGFKAQINSLPEGYGIVTAEAVYAEGETELTIVANVLESYKIIAVDQFGAKVPGVAVALAVDTTVHEAQNTDANGIVIFEVAPGDTVVANVTVPAGYKLDTTEFVIDVANNIYELEVVVTKLVTYTITLVDQIGEFVVGASVVITVDETAYEAVETDENGFASVEVVPGAAVTATVTLPAKYKLDESVITYPVTKTEITVDTVVAYEEYVVKAQELTQLPVANMVATLYKVEGDELVETLVTGADGKATFLAVKGLEYYVVLEHVNPAFKWVNSDPNLETEDPDDVLGIHAFGDATSFDASIVISTAEIDYVLNVKDAAGEAVVADVKVYNELLNLVTETTTDENGVATIALPNGTYYMVVSGENISAPYVEFKKDGVVEATVTVAEAAAGSSADNAIFLASGSNEVYDEIAEGTTLYYVVADAGSTIINIECYAAFSVEYNGQTLTPEDGELLIPVTENIGEKAVIKVNYTEATSYVGFGVNKIGSELNPIELDEATVNGSTLKATLNGNWNSIYYVFVATKDATVTLTSEDVNAVLSVNGMDASAPVSAGDKVVITVNACDEDTWEYLFGELEFTVEYAEKYVDYTVNVAKDYEAAEGITVSLYTGIWDENAWTYEYTAVDGKTGVTLADGKFKFEGLLEKANYFVKVELPDGYECYYEYSQFEKVIDSDTGAEFYEVYVSITHELNGSKEYPYEPEFETNFMTGAQMATLSIPATGEVWYNILVPYGNWIIGTSNENLEIKFYVDGPDAEPVLLAWSEENGLFCAQIEGFFAPVLVSVSSKTGEAIEDMLIMAEKVEPQVPGASYDSAIQISDAGTYTASVNGAPVYYQFVSSGSVTVTITDKENAVLCTVIYNPMLGGEVVSPTVDGTFTEPMAYGFTYFLIDAAELGGSGEFEFTVEFTPEA